MQMRLSHYLIGCSGKPQQIEGLEVHIGMWLGCARVVHRGGHEGGHSSAHSNAH